MNNLVSNIKVIKEIFYINKRVFMLYYILILYNLEN